MRRAGGGTTRPAGNENYLGEDVWKVEALKAAQGGGRRDHVPGEVGGGGDAENTWEPEENVGGEAIAGAAGDDDEGRAAAGWPSTVGAGEAAASSSLPPPRATDAVASDDDDAAVFDDDDDDDDDDENVGDAPEQRARQRRRRRDVGRTRCVVRVRPRADRRGAGRACRYARHVDSGARGAPTAASPCASPEYVQYLLEDGVHLAADSEAMPARVTPQLDERLNSAFTEEDERDDETTETKTTTSLSDDERAAAFRV